jgi:flagellar biosynthesis anti-sigma factor FlgM
MKVANDSGASSTKIDGVSTSRSNTTSEVKKKLKSGGIGGNPALKGELLGGSKVDVSQNAQMMQKAKEIASESSIDEAKVARLQKMIDSGTYSVDADKIADRLVDEHMMIPD